MRDYLAKLYHRLGRTLGTQTPWVFLFGTIAVGFISDGIGRLIEAQWLGQSTTLGWRILGLGAALLVLVIIFFNLPQMAAGWVRALRRQPALDMRLDRSVPRRRGLVAIVSLGTFVPAEAAMAYHAQPAPDEISPVLQYCWLLVGPGEGDLSSTANAEKLQEAFEAKGIKVELWDLQESDNIEECFQAVKTIVRIARHQYQIGVDELIADFTGGTKSMTAGMTLACVDLGLDMQYMKPDEYEIDGRAKRGTKSIPQMVDVTFKDDGERP